MNLFISFPKQTRSTNKIHLWERLFKFDFLLFFFTRNKKQNPIHFYRNWALIKRGRVNDPFEKWRVTTSQWQFLPVRANTHTHTNSTYGRRRIKRRSRNIYTSFYLLRLPEYLHINTDVSVYSNRVNIVSIAGVSRDKRRNIAHTRHPSAVIKCRVMIDEPLLVICCFKVSPLVAVPSDTSSFPLHFRSENWKFPNSRGRGKKAGQQRGGGGGGGWIWRDTKSSSSFITASGWIKLDGRATVWKGG